MGSSDEISSTFTKEDSRSIFEPSDRGQIDHLPILWTECRWNDEIELQWKQNSDRFSPRTIRWAKYSLPSTTSIKSQNLDSFHIWARTCLASISFVDWRNRWTISRSWASVLIVDEVSCSVNLNVNGFDRRVDEEVEEVSLVFADWELWRSKIDRRRRKGRTSIKEEEEEGKRRKKSFFTSAQIHAPYKKNMLTTEDSSAVSNVNRKYSFTSLPDRWRRSREKVTRLIEWVLLQVAIERNQRTTEVSKLLLSRRFQHLRVLPYISQTSSPDNRTSIDMKRSGANVNAWVIDFIWSRRKLWSLF